MICSHSTLKLKRMRASTALVLVTKVGNEINKIISE
jgi:hypothetical protein